MDDPETGLWKPFGSRRVVHVCAGDTAEALHRAGIHYVLVSAQKFPILIPTPFDDWLAGIHGEIIQTIPLNLRAGQPPVNWLLVKLRPSAR